MKFIPKVCEFCNQPIVPRKRRYTTKEWRQRRFCSVRCANRFGKGGQIILDNGMKVCPTCSEVKELNQFQRAPKKPSGHISQCHACVNRARALRDIPPDKARVQSLKRYGITLGEYKALLIKQRGICAICSLPERVIDARTGLIRQLAVDHDHATGRIRGLLCARCNQGLGCFKDNSVILCTALLYMEDYGA